MMLHTQHLSSRPYGFRKENLFHLFPNVGLIKHVTLGQGHSWPQGYILNKLGRGPLGDATYQISRL